jgi:hypothetical protein
MGGGFSLGASVGISTVGSDVRLFGRGVGVAFTVIAGSKSLGAAASWARATCDAPNAILLHRIETRIPLWKHIQKLSAVFRSPQSGINSSVYFRSRYFVCFVPALLLLSGRSSINSSGGPRRAACECRCARAYLPLKSSEGH